MPLPWFVFTSEYTLNGTGFRAFDTAAEQPILSSNRKGSNRVLGQIIGDGDISIVQKRHELLLLMQGTPYRLA
jgi:hypothetical protein